MARPSRLILVAQHRASALLRLDAMKAGMCDVVERPFDLNEVFGAVTSAWRTWNARRKPMPVAASQLAADLETPSGRGTASRASSVPANAEEDLTSPSAQSLMRSSASPHSSAHRTQP
jgi:DNA-binding response OmpR family regulator